MSILKIYTTEFCSDCWMAKKVLDELKIAYQEIDLEEHPEETEVVIAARGKRVVPTLEYDGKFMDGNRFNRAKFEEELKSLLA